MALVRQWARQTYGPTPKTSWPTNVMSNYDAVISPGLGYTLLRTQVHFNLALSVPAATPWPADFPANTRALLGVKWSPTLTDPTMDQKDDSEGVIAMQLLRPTYVQAGGTVNREYMFFEQPEPIDVHTMRKAPAADFPAVWTYLLFMDSFGYVASGHPDLFFVIDSQIATLWGK